MRHKAKEYFGWYGVIAILTAYLLVSFNVIVAKSLSYQLLNLTGSLGIIVIATSKKDTQPVVLNIIWAAIAIIAIVRLLIA